MKKFSGSSGQMALEANSFDGRVTRALPSPQLAIGRPTPEARVWFAYRRSARAFP
jgi:hypothetical protein